MWKKKLEANQGKSGRKRGKQYSSVAVEASFRVHDGRNLPTKGTAPICSAAPSHGHQGPKSERRRKKRSSGVQFDWPSSCLSSPSSSASASSSSHFHRLRCRRRDTQNLKSSSSQHQHQHQGGHALPPQQPPPAASPAYLHRQHCGQSLRPPRYTTYHIHAHPPPWVTGVVDLPCHHLSAQLCTLRV